MTELTEPQGAFLTHQRYLCAFALLSTRAKPDLATAYESIRSDFATAADRPLPTKPIENTSQVCACLENAWGTEILLFVGMSYLQSDDIAGLSNNWNVVQAYYSAYHATQALAVARGFLRPDSHSKTQRIFHDLWGKLSPSFAPWSLSVGAEGHLPRIEGLDPSIHAWTQVDAKVAPSLCCKALRTTRDEAITEALTEARNQKWRERKKELDQRNAKRESRGKEPHPIHGLPKPKLSADERAVCAKKVRAHTLLDYLYRLRVRTNYTDTSMFTDGPRFSGESSEVRACIGSIVAATNYASELAIAACPMGPELLAGCCEGWVRKTSSASLAFGVGQRKGLWIPTKRLQRSVAW